MAIEMDSGMLARDRGGRAIQAFPLTSRTREGVFTDEPIDGYVVLHANEDTTLDIVFLNTATLHVNVYAGDDVAIIDGVRLTTSGNVKIS